MQSTSMATETKKRSRNESHLSGYECKTCKKRFETFQALGGHQGIHKKIKLGDESSNDTCALTLGMVVHKSVGLLHRCKTCKKEFETGQALGGHMRRHRLEKALVLMEKERLQSVDKQAESDLIMALKRLQSVDKAEEDERHEVINSDLVLAAKEWRLSV